MDHVVSRRRADTTAKVPHTATNSLHTRPPVSASVDVMLRGSEHFPSGVEGIRAYQSLVGVAGQLPSNGSSES